MSSTKDRITATVIFLATFLVFRLSPVETVFDSRYEMFFSQQLLRNHSFSAPAQAFAELQSHKPGQIHQRGADLPYQLVQVGDRFYYSFPPGSVILSVPYVAVTNAFGIFATDEHGVYDNKGESRIQKGLAALLMGGLCALVFLSSRLVLSRPWSLLITIGTAFGTQVWSTASRAMWSQTWGIFLLELALCMVLQTDVKQTRLRPILLGTCLSWMYFVRPTFSVSIVGITLYVLIYRRATVLPLVTTGVCWLAAFLAWSQYHFGHFMPNYYSDYPFAAAFLWPGVAGSLFSPSRGLFVFVPILAFVIYLCARYGANGRRSLLLIAAGVSLAHLVVISLFPVWYGGHCYGPRYTTDLVPWLTLLAILGMEARQNWRRNNAAKDSRLRLGAEWGVAIPLLICSIILNGIGALWLSALWWNVRPTNIDEDHQRLWDWKHPQFLGAPND
jgi:hypothetical protein